MFKGFKAVGVVHDVVACKDNGKVGGCSDGDIAGSGGYKVGCDRLVLVCGGIK